MYEVKSESFLPNVNRLLRIKASIYVLVTQWSGKSYKSVMDRKAKTQLKV